LRPLIAHPHQHELISMTAEPFCWLSSYSQAENVSAEDAMQTAVDSAKLIGWLLFSFAALHASAMYSVSQTARHYHTSIPCNRCIPSVYHADSDGACWQAMEQLHQWDADGLIMARKHIQRAQAELANVVQTAHFGVGPAVGFHPDVNRRLLGPLPPRPVQVDPPPPSTLQC